LNTFHERPQVDCQKVLRDNPLAPRRAPAATLFYQDRRQTSAGISNGFDSLFGGQLTGRLEVKSNQDTTINEKTSRAVVGDDVQLVRKYSFVNDPVYISDGDGGHDRGFGGRQCQLCLQANYSTLAKYSDASEDILDSDILQRVSLATEPNPTVAFYWTALLARPTSGHSNGPLAKGNAS